jgi:hypothetical protein
MMFSLRVLSEVSVEAGPLSLVSGSLLVQSWIMGSVHDVLVS